MQDHFGAIMALWTIGAGVLCIGVSWGTVRTLQRSFEKTLQDIIKQIKALDKRLDQDEKTYVTAEQCRYMKADCLDGRKSEMSRVYQELADIKILMKEMDARREAARVEMLAAIRELWQALHDEARDGTRYYQLPARKD